MSDTVRIETTSSYWTGLLGDTSMSGPGIDAPEIRSDRGELFVISGVLRNVSDEPLRAVRLAFELVDESGRVVYRQDGYNYGAEALVAAPPESPVEDSPDPAAVPTTPVPPGAEGRFRMILFGAELPDFERVAVRPLAAEPCEDPADRR